MTKKSFHLYSDDEKIHIVREQIQNRLSIRACNTKYIVAITSFVMWLDLYRLHGKEGLKIQIGKKKVVERGEFLELYKAKTTIEKLGYISRLKD